MKFFFPFSQPLKLFLLKSMRISRDQIESIVMNAIHIAYLERSIFTFDLFTLSDIISIYFRIKFEELHGTISDLFFISMKSRFVFFMWTESDKKGTVGMSIYLYIVTHKSNIC